MFLARQLHGSEGLPVRQGNRDWRGTEASTRLPLTPSQSLERHAEGTRFHAERCLVCGVVAFFECQLRELSMFEQYRMRAGGSLDIFAGIAAAGALSACMSTLLLFGAVDEAASATTAPQTAVVMTAGKSDKLCGHGDWAPYDIGCTRRIMVQSGRDASVRVVGANTSIAERDMTSNERIRAAFEALAHPTSTAASRMVEVR